MNRPRSTTGVARQYAILQELHRRHARPAPSDASQVWLRTDELRHLSQEYQFNEASTPAERAAARKLLLRDLAVLERRGLIDTGATTPDTPNARGVRLRQVTKPRSLHFTEEEHAALQRARTRMQPGPVLAAPGQPSDIDLADAVLRHLQEHGGEAAGSDLARRLGVPEGRLQRVLRNIYAPANLAVDVVNDLELDFEQLPDGRLAPGWTVTLTDRDELAGLGGVGRFAYNADEVSERLRLLETALTHPDTPERENALLTSARSRLVEWQRELAKSRRMAGRRRGPDGLRRGRGSRVAAPDPE